MAFSDVIVECAFNSVLGEDLSAQTGYTEITKFVNSVSGTLRGRGYELDRVETGSISIELDNADGRFTPGSELSPYSPMVKANRRLRIRGKNMQSLNVARTGGKGRDTQGFFYPIAFTSNNGAGHQPGHVINSPSLVEHDPVSLGLSGALADERYHIEGTLKGATQTGDDGYRIISYYCPIELGVRMTHSAYVWRAAGTEPSGTKVYLVNSYYDADDNEIELPEGAGNVEWTNTPTTPTRRVFSDLPPNNAKYMIQSVAVVLNQYLYEDLTYGIVGIQSEIPTNNLVPSISGYYDLDAWELQGGGVITAINGIGIEPTVEVQWAPDSIELKCVVPHLVPGERYSFAAWVRRRGGIAAGVLITGDDGLTGATIPYDNAWHPISLTFTATRAEHPIKVIPQVLAPPSDFGDGTYGGGSFGNLTATPGLGTPVAGTFGTATMGVGGTFGNLSAGADSGTFFDIKQARCTYAQDNLQPADSAWDTDETEWERPKPIFDGWVERWPIHVTGGSSTMTIVVNDRLKKTGEIKLEGTLRETLIRDDADLILPLTDAPENSGGSVSVLGNWTEASGESQLVPSTAKAGPGTSGFLLGDLTGPTTEDALRLAPYVANVGYALALPWSPDYATRTPVPNRSPVPPPPVKRNYLRKYEATWSRTYKGDNQARATTSSGHLYQGLAKKDDPNGNQLSLIGFNWESIVHDLTGTAVLEIAFAAYAFDWGIYDVKPQPASKGKSSHKVQTAPPKGGTAFIGTHNYFYKSAPSYYTPSNGWERRWTVEKWPKEHWRIVRLGAAVGASFKNGLTGGIVIGWGNNDPLTYGEFGGASSDTYRPYLMIKYRK